jgi:hypothetical protein
MRRDGLNYPPRTSSLHASFDVLCGRCWVMFGVVAGPVLGAPIPVMMKLILGCTATEPPKSHIHHIGPAGDNIFIGNSCGCRVISLDRTFWLVPTHGNEGLAVGNHFSCSDE